MSVLRSILTHFDAESSPIDEYDGDDGELILDVTAPDLAVLIGRHGRTLESLQVLVSLLVSRKLGFRIQLLLTWKATRVAAMTRLFLWLTLLHLVLFVSMAPFLFLL